MSEVTTITKREEYLRDLLTDAIEGGMTSQWAQYVSIERADDLSVTKVVLRDEYEPVNAEAQKWTVTTRTMAHGLGVIREGKANYGYMVQELLLSSRTNGEDGDYDAISADAVLQAGLFEEVIYG